MPSCTVLSPRLPVPLRSLIVPSQKRRRLADATFVRGTSPGRYCCASEAVRPPAATGTLRHGDTALSASGAGATRIRLALIKSLSTMKHSVRPDDPPHDGMLLARLQRPCGGRPFRGWDQGPVGSLTGVPSHLAIWHTTSKRQIGTRSLAYTGTHAPPHTMRYPVHKREDQPRFLNT